jgi:hypothetical protein
MTWCEAHGTDDGCGTPNSCSCISLQLEWDSRGQFAFFQRASLVPRQYSYVFLAFVLMLVTVGAAANVAWKYEWHRRLYQNGPSGLPMTPQFARDALKVSRKKRAIAAVLTGSATAVESVGFWFNIFWLNELCRNQDVRYGSYAQTATCIVGLAITACFALSLTLICTSLQSKYGEVSLLDKSVMKKGVMVWSVIVIASWGATPWLLTLLPWTNRVYYGYPTQRAMNYSFGIKTAMAIALIAIKSRMALSLEDNNRLLWWSMAFDFILLTRYLIEKMLMSMMASQAKREQERSNPDSAVRKLVRSGDVSSFFEGTMDKDSEGRGSESLEINPVIVHKAQRSIERERMKRMKSSNGGSQAAAAASPKRAGLSRLRLGTIGGASKLTKEERDAKLVDRYLMNEAISYTVEDAFDRFDHDRSGDIDMEELREALESLGLQADDKHLAALMDRFDVSKDGRLQVDEFRQLVTELRKSPKGTESQRAGRIKSDRLNNDIDEKRRQSQREALRQQRTQQHLAREGRTARFGDSHADAYDRTDASGDSRMLPETDETEEGRGADGGMYDADAGGLRDMGSSSAAGRTAPRSRAGNRRGSCRDRKSEYLPGQLEEPGASRMVSKQL